MVVSKPDNYIAATDHGFLKTSLNLAFVNKSKLTFAFLGTFLILWSGKN